MEAEELKTTARMARLSLSAAEEEKLRQGVERMLAYCSHMASLPVDDLEPTTHALLSKNRLRPDVDPTGPSGSVSPATGPAPSWPVEALLANAPEREDRFILIPNVL
jgi:aspartyl-tRNA(Asn)/glutamyl-tRNA(Gln) amidotransferase subunit C